MEKVKGSKEMLEELFNLQAVHPNDHTAMMGFAKKIGACTLQQHGRTYAEYGELFHNCLDIINLRQQIEQSDVLSKQTTWVKRYTYATFALVVATCLIAIFR